MCQYSFVNGFILLHFLHTLVFGFSIMLVLSSVIRILCSLYYFYMFLGFVPKSSINNNKINIRCVNNNHPHKKIFIVFFIFLPPFLFLFCIFLFLFLKCNKYSDNNILIYFLLVYIPGFLCFLFLYFL